MLQIVWHPFLCTTIILPKSRDGMNIVLARIHIGTFGIERRHSLLEYFNIDGLCGACAARGEGRQAAKDKGQGLFCE